MSSRKKIKLLYSIVTTAIVVSLGLMLPRHDWYYYLIGAVLGNAIIWVFDL